MPKGAYLEVHFADLINPKPPKPEQTFDEIVSGVLEKLNEMR